MASTIEQLFDIPRLRKLLDDIHAATGITATIVDTEGNRLIASGWQTVCADFFSKCPDTATKCAANRMWMIRSALEQEGGHIVTCPHGLMDAATPILVDGRHLGSIVIGQVFLEPPDNELFRQEAARRGFDESVFLEAVAKVPVITRDQFERNLRFMGSLATELAALGHARIVSAQCEAEAIQHAERTVTNMRRQKSLLKLYAMEFCSCNELLDFGLEEALALTGSPIGYIYEYDEDSRIFTLYAWSNSVMPLCLVQNPQTVYPLEKTGLWGEAVRQRRPIITNNYPADNPLKKGVPEGHAPLLRHMNLPVFRNDRIVAVIGVGNKQTDYTEDDVRQLKLFMDSLFNIVQRHKSEEELVIARESAIAANRMKSEFLSTLSHELRTPLNGVIGGIQLLQLTDLSPEQTEYLGMIDISASNELKLVNDLLELARLESDGVAPENQPFSLRQCIDETVRMHADSARAKGLSLQQAIAAGIPPELFGDSLKIKQALHHLLGNAVKFTDQGTVTVEANVQQNDGRGLIIGISVVDTGIGIAPENLLHIFDLFTQADMSHNRKYGGLGMGLSLCRKLVELLGGRIWAESSPGLGSSFHLEVPVQQPVAVETAGATFAVSARPRTLLLVEDDYVSSFTAAALLRKMGHQVTPVANGKEAVKAYRKSAFDLVLMDIQMPLMSGMEAMLAIRAQDQELQRPPAKIVAQTAYVSRLRKDELLREGFDGFIAKPLKREDLESTIERLCA